MDKAKKEKFIIFSTLILLLLIIVIYLIFFINSKNNKSSANDFSVPDVVKTENKSEYQSRIEKANEHREPSKKDVTKDLDFEVYETDTSSIIASEESLKESVLNDLKELEESNQSVNNTSTKNRSTPKKTSVETPSNQNSNPVDASQNTIIADPVIENPPSKPKGGFGIVRSQNSEDNSKSLQNNSFNESKFFSVMLEESIEIKNNTSVVFIILEDIILNNITFYKNSIAFGKAKNSSSYFDISIYQIKNTDGKVYNVSEQMFFVFDEKYSRGFPFEGKLNESVKDGTAEGISSISPSVGGVAAQTSVNIAERVIDKVSRKSEPSISLEKGYRIYIKTVKN
jgi:hypothetical protein